MKYLVTLTPLEPFLFGGDTTFGKLGDEEQGTYLVKSRQFPQQSALLGMLKKEIMTQAGLLTRKVRGEWVDPGKKPQAATLTGKEKFDIFSEEKQDFGVIRSIGALFLVQDKKHFIKKANIDKYTYNNGLLEGFSPKEDIYDNFVSLDNTVRKCASDIFRPVEQVGNKTGGMDNSLFKKTSYLLKDGFKFGFYLDLDFQLEDAIVHLGADGSAFRMTLQPDDGELSYEDPNGYLTLLSDAYITVPTKSHCEFAVTSEISFRTLSSKKHATRHNPFQKSRRVYLYEKGSVFIKPDETLIADLKKENCRQIGLNQFAYKG